MFFGKLLTLPGLIQQAGCFAVIHWPPFLLDADSRLAREIEIVNGGISAGAGIMKDCKCGHY